MDADIAPNGQGKEPLFLPKTPSPAPPRAGLPTPPPSGQSRAGKPLFTTIETPTRPVKRQRDAVFVEDDDEDEDIEFLFATPRGTRAVAVHHGIESAPLKMLRRDAAEQEIDDYLDLAADYRRPVLFDEEEEPMEFDGAVPADTGRRASAFKRHKAEVIVVDDEEDDDASATPLRAVSEEDRDHQGLPSATRPHESCPTCGCNSHIRRPGPSKGRKNLPPSAMAAILRCLLNGHPYRSLSLHTQLNQSGVHVSWPDIPQLFGVDGKHHDAVRAAAKWLQENIPRMYENSEYARR